METAGRNGLERVSPAFVGGRCRRAGAVAVWLAMSVLLGSPAQARPPIERTIHVNAPPEVVYELLADLQGWGEWADVGPLVSDGAHVSIRGEPYSLDQELRWAGAGLGSGRVQVTDAHADHLGFDLVRTAPAGFGVDTWTRWRQSTRVRWRAVEHGTAVRWQVRVRNVTALPKNVGRSVEEGLAALKLAAEQELAPPVRPETAVSVGHALAVWQGFDQEWTYNHRINRLGSWVTPPVCDGEGCEVDLVHAVASGSGADQASFSNRVALVTAPGMEVHYGTSTLWFTGREGSVLEDGDCKSIPGTSEGGAALLEGFDVAALKSAHSLWGLSLGVSHERVEDVDVLCVSGALRMACRTAECRRDRWTQYAIDVHWAYVRAPGMTASEVPVEPEQIQWFDGDIRDMLRPEQFVQPHTLAGAAGPELATAGFSSLSIQLDGPFHTRALSMGLEPRQYRSETGELDVRLSRFYQQWGPVEIAPMTVAQLSKPGVARLSVGVVVLQFDEGCLEQAERDGGLFWPGGNLDGSAPEAQVTHAVQFSSEEGCAEGGAQR